MMCQRPLAVLVGGFVVRLCGNVERLRALGGSVSVEIQKKIGVGFPMRLLVTAYRRITVAPLVRQDLEKLAPAVGIEPTTN